MQLPVEDRKDVSLSTHLVQFDARGPEHSRQVSWQRTHVPVRLAADP